MSVELVYESLRRDENGVLEGETRATYASVEEAVLQAAHDLMVGGDKALRVEKDGSQVKGPADFRKALTAYRKARNKGLAMDDFGSISVDTSGHVKAMKGI